MPQSPNADQPAFAPLVGEWGIYVHVPYCRQACTYCDFYFTTSRKSEAAYLRALATEIRLRAAAWPALVPAASLYLGGGTPSLLAPSALRALLMDIRNAYGLLPDAEITLEANPDDLSAERLADWQALGINRLSLGVQAFQAEQLSWMHRAHSAEQALAAVPLLRAAGFAQYTVDLIYAAPGLTDTHWQENLARLADWQVPHISAYALTVEPRTALAKWVSTGKIAAPHDEAFARQFELLQQWAAQNGYQHYEVSNLALPGYRARHNSNYWHSRPYVGLGPGAHGFDGHRTRYHNLPDVWAYAQAGEAGQLPPTELESLSPIDRFNECLMTGLRLLEGASLGDLQAWCPPDRWPGWLAELQTYLTQERLQLAPGGFLRLPENLRTHADGIAADLFLLEEAVAGA